MHSKKYIDISKNPQADKEAARLLQALKDQCTHMLKPKRVCTYSVKGPQICLPVQPQVYMCSDTFSIPFFTLLKGPDVKYLEKFRDDFCEKIVEGILEGVKGSAIDVESHVDEVLYHIH